MSHSRRWSSYLPRTGFTLGSVAVVGVAVLTGCSPPTFEGPQIQEPPEGFRYDANAEQSRNVFPDREELWQGAWFRIETVNDDHASIFLTAYRGGAGREQVEAAREAQASRYARPGRMRYGELEELRIDGRTAWGWTESQYRSDGSVAALQYKAVVPYDTVTYAVEFFSTLEPWMDVDTLRATVMTFAVGRTEVSWRGVAVTAFLLALAAGWIGKKARPVSLHQGRGEQAPPG